MGSVFGEKKSKTVNIQHRILNTSINTLISMRTRMANGRTLSDIFGDIEHHRIIPFSLMYIVYINELNYRKIFYHSVCCMQANWSIVTNCSHQSFQLSSTNEATGKEQFYSGTNRIQEIICVCIVHIWNVHFVLTFSQRSWTSILFADWKVDSATRNILSIYSNFLRINSPASK